MVSVGVWFFLSWAVLTRDWGMDGSQRTTREAGATVQEVRPTRVVGKWIMVGDCVNWFVFS